MSLPAIIARVAGQIAKQTAKTAAKKGTEKAAVSRTELKSTRQWISREIGRIDKELSELPYRSQEAKVLRGQKSRLSRQSSLLTQRTATGKRRAQSTFRRVLADVREYRSALFGNKRLDAARAARPRTGAERRASSFRFEFEQALSGRGSTLMGTKDKSEFAAKSFMKWTRKLWSGEPNDRRLDVILDKLGAKNLGEAFEMFMEAEGENVREGLRLMEDLGDVSSELREFLDSEQDDKIGSPPGLAVIGDRVAA